MSDLSARLYLITPVIDDAAAFLPRLEASLAAGDVACLLLRLPIHDERLRRDIAGALAPLVQNYGTALLLDGDTRAVASAGADGAHVAQNGDDLEEALRSLKPSRIVGAGGLLSRDDAMVAGERGADYVMFGDRLNADPEPSLGDRLERVTWWAEIFQVPCVACAYALAEVEPLAVAGADFVALGEAVWDDARGPDAAVRDALQALDAAHIRRTALAEEGA